MAEPGLSTTFESILRRICRFLGWSRTGVVSNGTIAIVAGTVTLTGGTWPSWAANGTLVYGLNLYTVASRTNGTTLVLDDTSVTVSSGASYTLFAYNEDKTRDLLDIVYSGVRNVVVPQAIDGYSHRWSWMDPQASFATVAPYSTGTVTIVAGVVTLAGGTFPSWAASGDLRVGGVSYSVSSRDSGTQVTLDDTSVTASAGSTYSIVQQTYDLPDDFGGLFGAMTYRQGTSGNFFTQIKQRSEAEIMRRQDALISTGAPQYFAIRPKVQSASTSSGQRFEIMFDVPPDAAYSLQYRYSREPEAMTQANRFPPGGGVWMSELYIESCLAAAEVMLQDTIGVHSQRAMELLKAAIEKDRLEMTPDSLGVDYGDPCYSDGIRELRMTPSVQITVNV